MAFDTTAIPTATDQEWFEMAILYLRTVASWALPFTAQNVSSYAYEHGLKRPSSERAWGIVMSKAARRGLIRRVGFKVCEYEYSDRKSSAPQMMWVRA